MSRSLRGRSAGESRAIRGRAETEHAGEVLPQDGGRAESALESHGIQPQVRLFEQALRVDDALPSEPRGGRRTVVGLEAAGERRGDMCARAASWSTERSRLRFSSTQSVIGESESDVVAGSGVAMNCACPPSRCGGTTMRRAIVLVISAPSSMRSRCRQASSPAAVPALVMMRPSCTYRTLGSTSMSGYIAAIVSA